MGPLSLSLEKHLKIDSKFLFRFFWTRVEGEFTVDRKVNQLDMTRWREIRDRKIDGFPALPERTTEIDNGTGKELSWSVHVYENFHQPTITGTDFRFGA